MPKNNGVVRTPVETREDFRTDVDPSLFIDNWGEDVVARYGNRINAQIEAAVALAQLISSIRSEEPVNIDALDADILNGIAFVDGNDGQKDHFFSLELESIFRGGSYEGNRVGARLMTGYVRLEPYNGGNSTYAHYDERWSTKRGDAMGDRDPRLFDEDLRRINNVLSVLEGASEEDLNIERPESWPEQPFDIKPSQTTLTGLNIAKNPIYVGKYPLENVDTEPDRIVHIPFLDN